MYGLNEFSEWLTTLSKDTEQVRLLFVILLGLVGFTLALALSIVANAIFNPVKKRIDIVQNEELQKTSKQPIKDLFQRIGAIIVPKADEKRSKVAYQLETAGYRSTRALAYFFSAKLAGFVLAPLVVLSVSVLFTNRPILNDLSLALIAGALAFLAPSYWLKYVIKRRQKHLRHALPDALDLMVVCSEAGLGLNAAIKRVADEIGVQHPRRHGQPHCPQGTGTKNRIGRHQCVRHHLAPGPALRHQHRSKPADLLR